jgi:TetR/AcrR family transcriptional repressor of mexJK operon
MAYARNNPQPRKLATQAVAEPSLSIRKRELRQRNHSLRDAATRVFLEHGYDSATMELVAAEAKVTKKTVYNHFAGKDAMFAAVIESLCDGMLAELHHEAEFSGDLEEELTRFCDQLILAVGVPPGLEVFRLAISVAKRFPELGRALYRAGPERVTDAVGTYLDEQVAAGRLAIADTRLAARYLMGMIAGRLQLALMGDVIRPRSEVTRQYVRGAVQLFCRAHAVSAAPKPAAGSKKRR